MKEELESMEILGSFLKWVFQKRKVLSGNLWVLMIEKVSGKWVCDGFDGKMWEEIGFMVGIVF